MIKYIIVGLLLAFILVSCGSNTSIIDGETVTGTVIELNISMTNPDTSYIIIEAIDEQRKSFGIYASKFGWLEKGKKYIFTYRSLDNYVTSATEIK